MDLLHPSMHVIGKSLGAVVEFAMTPFTGLQYLNDKAKLNLQHRLQQYAHCLAQIPEEKRCAVRPELGVPILQRLSYTTNDEIADMFITLLTNASNIDTCGSAHPTYISIIERLSPDEARMLLFIHQQYLSINSTAIPYVSFRGRPLRCVENIQKANALDDINSVFDDFFISEELNNWLTIIPKEVVLTMPENINMYWANLISCGIISDAKDVEKVDSTQDYYDIEVYNHFDKCLQENIPNKYGKVYSGHSHFRITELGKHFIEMCIRKV